MVGSTKLTKINFRFQDLADGANKHKFMGGISMIASGDSITSFHILLTVKSFQEVRVFGRVVVAIKYFNILTICKVDLFVLPCPLLLTLPYPGFLRHPIPGGVKVTRSTFRLQNFRKSQDADFFS